jgi:hypothetical protein
MPFPVTTGATIMKPRPPAALLPTLLVLPLLSPLISHADTLTTPSFVVQIKANCAEGNVTCDNVSYIGTSKKTGKAITLRGKTVHSMCADGVTPCKFRGYEFKSGAVQYLVMEEGDLIVRQGQKVLVQEHGEWQY